MAFLGHRGWFLFLIQTWIELLKDKRTFCSFIAHLSSAAAVLAAPVVKAKTIRDYIYAELVYIWKLHTFLFDSSVGKAPFPFLPLGKLGWLCMTSSTKVIFTTPHFPHKRSDATSDLKIPFVVRTEASLIKKHFVVWQDQTDKIPNNDVYNDDDNDQTSKKQRLCVITFPLFSTFCVTAHFL